MELEKIKGGELERREGEEVNLNQVWKWPPCMWRKSLKFLEKGALEQVNHHNLLSTSNQIQNFWSDQELERGENKIK